jgi:hypothetical protein
VLSVALEETLRSIRGNNAVRKETSACVLEAKQNAPLKCHLQSARLRKLN